MRLSKAIVTGATGVLGRALVKKLLSVGIETYAVCRPGSSRNELLSPNVDLHKVECDLSELAELQKNIDRSMDVFFHFAWIGNEEKSSSMNMPLQIRNIQYSVDAAEIAYDLGCKVFIGAGSQTEYGNFSGIIHPDTPANPASGYGMAKLCAGFMTRAVCKKYGIRHIWPRIFTVYGIGARKQSFVQMVIDKLLRGERPALTEGKQIWDFIYADDAAEAFYRMAICGKDGSVYPLGSGHPKILREYVESIRDAINPELPLGFGEIPYRPGQIMHMEPDVSALFADTGWEAQTEFASGIREIVDDMKAQADCNEN